ncbi:hypothetical protein TNCV_1268841 [Trichonephila clavipes]|nr:hypothetical protein TNCV_1268841 [Trichonephila clavipes]
MASVECMAGSRAPTPQRYSASCSVYRQCVLERCGSEIQYHLDHDTGCRTNVTMYNATVQQPLTTVSPNSNSTIVMLLAEARFFSKHNVVPFRYPCSPLITPLVAQMPAVSS